MPLGMENNIHIAKKAPGAINKCRIISCVGEVATFPGPWRGMDHQVIGIHEGDKPACQGRGVFSVKVDRP